MTFSNGRAPSQSNLRMFEQPVMWRRCADLGDDNEKSVIKLHCARELGSILTNCFNATNVLLLTRAGASSCASNQNDSTLHNKTAPQLVDLWHSVKDEIGAAAFDGIFLLLNVPEPDSEGGTR